MAAPKGNKNAAKAKDWETALRYALKKYQSGTIEQGTALREIATKTIEIALEGNLNAINQIADRLDGKPTQNIHGEMTYTHEIESLTDNELATRIKELERELLATHAGAEEATEQDSTPKRPNSVH